MYCVLYVPYRTVPYRETTHNDRIREYWHRPDDVVVGFVMGLASAHWAFRLVVLMPFRHEIGSPDWKKDPKWLEDEEQQWEEEEEELRLCGWRGPARRKKGAPRIVTPKGNEAGKGRPLQVSWRAGGRDAGGAYLVQQRALWLGRANLHSGHGLVFP